MATKEMTHLGTYVVPKVNLLPPEIDEKRAQQRSYLAMGALVIAALGTVGFLYTAQSARVGKANAELEATRRTNTGLATERAQLAYVEVKFAVTDAHEAMLAQAVEKRVRWSRNLHDLSLTMPANVWLTKLSIVQDMDGASVAPGTNTVLLDPGLGAIAFEGRALSHDGVASWLSAMTKIKGYANPYFTESKLIRPLADAPAADREYVEWAGTVSLSPALLQPKSVTK